MENRVTFRSEVHFTSLFQAAAYWVRKGYEVFPIRQFGNSPITKNGFKDATSEPSVYGEWFSKEKYKQIPFVNIATVPMESSSIFDVDVDMHGKENGLESWRNLTRNKHIPRTLTELTQSGGLHMAFMADMPVKSRVGILPGVDIIGQRHYAIRAPSVREKGSYHVFDWKIANAPAWLLELIEEEKQPNVKGAIALEYKGDGKVDHEAVIVSLYDVWKSGPSGHSYRANMAMSLAGFLLRKNISADSVKFIISELGRRTGHADHSRVVDYTLDKLVSGSSRVTGATRMSEIIAEVKSCLTTS